MEKKPNPGSDEAIKWKAVSRFEGLYEVSNTGLVRSLRYYGRNGKIGILKPRWTKITPRNRSRYSSVRLIDRKHRLDLQYRIHRLVADAFVLNPMSHNEVNHIDCNTENNDFRNLEWVSSSENHKHAIKNGLMTMDKARAAQIENSKKFHWIKGDGEKFLGSVRELMNHDRSIPFTALSLLYKVCNEGKKYSHYRTGFGWHVQWNPGSDGAIFKFSCSCPCMDNEHGAGCGWLGENGEPLFWITGACPLHGQKEENSHARN